VFVALSEEQARAWLAEAPIENSRGEIFRGTGFSEIYKEPPGVEGTACQALYVRMPKILKQRIEAAAKAEGVSLNVWSQRALEAALNPRREVSVGRFSG
jgi:hypothetical protein